MRIGVDYYPEHWEKSRWKIDAEMMQRANISLIRIAEFSWSLSEKTEGEFDFSWIDEAIDFFGSYGIRVVMCTPSATPPKWLVDKYPSILQEDIYNHPRHFGSRRHYCFNSPIYKEKTGIIVDRLAQHFADNIHIEAWQIDNEFGCQDTAYCYCDDCQREFRVWLKGKYHTIENLNKTYGTVFWSQCYNDFDEIIVPKASTCESSCPDTRGQNPSLYLDFKRFSSDSIIKYQKLQLDILRKYVNVPITTNFMGSYPEIDYFKLASDLDFVSWDNYRETQWGIGYAVDGSMDNALMRSLKKKPMWVMEQQSGPCGWSKMGPNPEPGKLRLWAYQAIANGAETVVFFRWRTALFGTEQYWHGILNHDGRPNRRYEEICQLGAELEELHKSIPYVEHRPKVAIVKFYDALWSHYIHPHANGFSYDKMLNEAYDALFALGLNADFVSPYEDLSSYKLIIAPALNLVDEEILENLEGFVKQGGHLLLTYRGGTRNIDNTMYELPIPGVFANLVGAEAEDFDPQSGRSVSVNGIFGLSNAKVWCDIMKETTAKPLAYYTSQYYGGKPAITENTFEKGKVYYMGCDLEEIPLKRFISYVCDSAGVSSDFQYPIYNIEIQETWHQNQKVTFIMNHNSSLQILKLEDKYNELLTGNVVEHSLTLQPYQVAILIKP